MAKDRDSNKELCSPLVMIGDASPLNRKLLKDILLRKGYRVFEITNGKRLMDAMLHHKPDLVLLNLNIMGLSGTEILNQVRQEKVLEDVPVILVGHWTSAESFVESDAYFNQPISAVQLCSTVDNLLARYKKYANS